ncbi:cytochrome C [Oceaniovalibus sp. ACAM 378]|uniref:c-type cytochrome n=1 Tax=Oceaniovalibus sp. ACAM 378 TaxID=2599923 RepID=UPI0011DA304E|nr:cytochrome C [Oceaniovalibus sp. ACAM 378]TYB86705.1 cytochrome C [Oceaniovalibus sp. ACAM 378]
MLAVCARVIALAATLAGTGALADSLPPAGATSCSGCHSAQMLSLDALSASEIVRALEEFRSGTRDATLMDRIASGFTEPESVAIAAWLKGE